MVSPAVLLKGVNDAADMLKTTGCGAVNAQGNYATLPPHDDEQAWRITLQITPKSNIRDPQLVVMGEQ